MTVSSLTLHVFKILENAWYIVYCGSFLQKQALTGTRDLSKQFLMPVLWKKIEFYQRERDREVIVIAVGGLGRVLQVSSSRKVFPLWGPFPPTKFFALTMKVLVTLLLPEMRHWRQ